MSADAHTRTLRAALAEAEAFVIAWATAKSFQDREYGLTYDTPHGWHPEHERVYEKVRAALALAPEGGAR